METLSSSRYGFAATHSRAKRKNDRDDAWLAVVDTLGQVIRIETPGSRRRHRWPVFELLNYPFLSSGGAALRLAAFEVQQNEAAQAGRPQLSPITWTKMQARRPWAGRSAPCLV